MTMIKGQTVVSGDVVEGEAIVSSMPFGFFGGVDPTTGLIVDEWHDLYNKNMKGKIFVFPEGRGSTVGAAVMLELARTKNAPLAILNNKSEIISASGCFLAKKLYEIDIPMLENFDCDITKDIKNGDCLRVNPELGTVEVL